VKLDRTEIAVLAGLVLLIVTLNAWWIAKQTGRQAKGMFEAQDASLVDGRVVWPDAGAR
jgi:hypothetical protein